MRCIVTGGAGFIGSNLVNKLIEEGHEVAVFDDLSTGKYKNINSKARFHKFDLTIRNVQYQDPLIKKTWEKADVVFHLAAFPRVEESIKKPIVSHRINIDSTIHILQACKYYKVKRLVFTSSSAVYGNTDVPTLEDNSINPMSPYALHKLMGEQYCKLFSDLYKIDTVSLRYSNVYGEGQPTEGPYCNVMGIFSKQKSEGKPMTIVGDGEQRRDFIHVDDVVDANIKVGFTDKVSFLGDVFNVGYGKSYSVNQIAEWMGGDTTNIEPRVEPRETLLDSNKIKSTFGWKPSIELKKWLKQK